MERAKGEALGRVFAVEFSFSTARSFNVLSSVTILVFFPVVPMDSVLRPLRIEGLNLPARAASVCPRTRRQREAVRNDYRAGRERSDRVMARRARGSGETRKVGLIMVPVHRRRNPLTARVTDFVRGGYSESAVCLSRLAVNKM